MITKKYNDVNQFVDDFDIFNLPTPTETKRNLQHEIYVPKIFFEKNRPFNTNDSCLFFSNLINTYRLENQNTFKNVSPQNKHSTTTLHKQST
jgi:hypothetical protein